MTGATPFSVWVAWSYEEWGNGVRAVASTKEELVEKLKYMFSFAEQITWGPIEHIANAPDGVDYTVKMLVGEIPGSRSDGVMNFELLEFPLGPSKVSY